MNRRPEGSEAPDYFFTYIDKAEGEDVCALLATQARDVPRWLRGVGEERSQYRYEPGKWSIRQVVCHLNDCERMFMFRAFWFARVLGFTLPSFDEGLAMETCGADERSLADLVAEFDAVRASSMALVNSLAPDAWHRSGIASGNSFSVRALVWISAGHVEHHVRLLRERYMVATD